jgi:hypothetical protein
MATIKSYTDLEQSKKLAEILPIESADMCFNDNEPCWSLVALLEQFEDTAGLAKDYGLWFCYDNRKSSCTKHYDNPVDACYEMILKLHELRVL